MSLDLLKVVSVVNAVSPVLPTGTWVWGNGQEITGLPWRGSIPDGGTKQNCLLVANDGYWDGECSWRRYVLCDLGKHGYGARKYDFIQF